MISAKKKKVAWYRVCRTCGGVGDLVGTRKSTRKNSHRNYTCAGCGNRWRAIIEPAKVLQIVADSADNPDNPDPPAS